MDCYKDEYSVRKEFVNGEEKYFLQFTSATGAVPEMEIDHKTYCLYSKKFSKPLKSQKYFKSAYGSNQNIEDLEGADDSALKVVSAEQLYLNKENEKEIESIIKNCTPTQQRRWSLRVKGLRYEEIAKIENCSHVAVMKSISLVSEKIKNNFF